MKKLYGMIALLCCVLLSACGKGGNSNNILPTKMEQVNTGGIIPEGSEAAEHDNSMYPPEMFYGSWELEDLSQIEDVDETVEVEIPDWTGEAEKIKISVFPTDMNYGSEESYLSIADTEVQKIAGMNTINATYLEEDSEVFLYGIYDTSESKLAVGIFNACGGLTSASDIETTEITEINYDISWTGYRLTLSYGDWQATYVPSDMEKIVVRDGRLMEGFEPFNGIKVLDLGGTVGENLYNCYYYDILNFGPEDTIALEFKEDGVADVMTSDGKAMQCQYYYSGKNISFKYDDVLSVYRECPNQSFSMSFESNIGYFFLIDGETQIFREQFSTFLNNGFNTEFSLDNKIESCKVTEPIPITYNGISVNVKLINPYENIISVSAAEVASLEITDTTGAVVKEQDDDYDFSIVCGKTTKEEVLAYYHDAPYEERQDYLAYKSGSLPFIYIPDVVSYSSILENTQGQKLLDCGTDVEIVFYFENDILNKIEFRRPEYLFNGLQDNVSAEVLESTDANTFSGVIEVRDSILDALKAEFEKENINVNIDENTGEIVLDSKVLFGVDEYDLTQEGKELIQRFAVAYLKVLLKQDYKDKLANIVYEGHTDTTGTHNYNQMLSEKRANSVYEYCLECIQSVLTEEDIEYFKSIVQTIGHAETDPVYTEEGQVDMDASRRVALKFFVNIN